LIERIFQDIPEDKISEADQHAYLVDLGWYRGTYWDDLLQSQRGLVTPFNEIYSHHANR